MTETEAREILNEAAEDEDLSEQEDEIFQAIYGRKPDANDRATGLISLCYAAL